MKRIYSLVIFVISCSFVNAQVVNAYASVANINGAKTTLTISNVDQTAHTFTAGGQVVVMQMQDDVIGANTGNNSNFGNIGNISNAGVYEIRTIASRSPAAGTPTSITLSSALSNNFNLNTNSLVQVITFRDLGINYTTTANITGLSWNGNIGGVIAVSVTNTLTLNHSITADGIGFIGGNRSNDNSGPVCSVGNNTVYTANNNNLGRKGEGIYLRTNNGYRNGRGKLTNGGGGGGDHNAGGGGGGNYTDGGQGGFGYQNCTAYSAGGLGGVTLAPYISGNRIFMGGGGGGGQENNTVGTNGGNGGGIILLKAGTLLTNTTCASAIRISANGQSSSNTTGGGNDGAGGGGAGGSIVLQVTTFSNSSACPLNINANGGSGGSVSNPAAHAGGGGGGQGVVMFSATQPTINVIATTLNGNPGTDNSGGSVTATPGSGTNNGGIISTASNPLPVELISFNGISEGTHNSVSWKSAVETNFKNYELESSEDGISFNKIATVNPIGNVSFTNNYNYLDFNSYSPITYYRLKMVDLDYTFEYSNIISVENGIHKTETLVVFPNPASNELYIKLIAPSEKEATVSVRDIYGRIVFSQTIDLTQTIDNTFINTTNFASGTYIVNITAGNTLSENIKVIITNKN